MKVTNNRLIYKQGYNTAYYFMFVLVFSALIFGVIIYIFIERVLIRRIYKLNDNIFNVSNSADVLKRIDIDNYDEIGGVGLSINSMLDRLYAAQAHERESSENEKKVSKQLKEQMSELQDSKNAIVNLLEDIEIEKKKIEETVQTRTKELSEEKSRLTASITSLSFGFVIASMKGRIILSNPILLKILDIDKAPETIEELSNLFTSFDFGKSYKECVDTQETVEINDIIYNNKYLKLFYAPVININKIIDYVIIIEDITETRIAEISKDEFFAVASHELRTPLTAIRGNADMILDMYADKITNNDVKEMISDIDIASVRLINLVNNFLEVSRLEQGKFDVKIEEIDLSEIINKVIKQLSGLAESKKISLIYNKSDEQLPKVMADKDHVEEVVLNIINNAIKYTNKGQIVVSNEVADYFIITRIADTGVGIEDKNQPLLFRKFQQANDKVLIRADSNSSGLGLYISRLLLKSMGGEITLDKSQPNSGSTFSFTLPRVV